jgi:dihydrofolate reductase
MKIAISAIDRNGLIGVDGKLAYRVASDLREFKRLTIDKTLVMGSTTYAETGNLPGRTILSLSSKGNLLNGQPTTIELKDLDSYVLCGGERVYKKYLNTCSVVILNRLIITPIKPIKNAKYFPMDQLNRDFSLVSTKKFDEFFQDIYLNNGY